MRLMDHSIELRAEHVENALRGHIHIFMPDAASALKSKSAHATHAAPRHDHDNACITSLI